MFGLLTTIIICSTIIYVVRFVQKHTITFTLHYLNENVKEPTKDLSDEDKKLIEDQNETINGMNEVIKLAQEFLGGGLDAESEYKAE